MGSGTRLKRDSSNSRIRASRFEQDGSDVGAQFGLGDDERSSTKARIITFALAAVEETVLHRTARHSVVHFAYVGDAIRVLARGAVLGVVPGASSKVVLKHRPATGSVVKKNDRRTTCTVGFRALS
jgi:hypothetical protein